MHDSKVNLGNELCICVCIVCYVVVRTQTFLHCYDTVCWTIIWP